MKIKSAYLLSVALALILVAGCVFMLNGRPQKQIAQVSTQPAVMPPGPPGDFKQMQKAHRYAFQLMKLVGSIGRLEDGKGALTPVQARSVLAVLEPLRKLKSLDEPQARDAVKSLQGILTDEQRQAISAMPDEHQFRKSGPPMGRSAGPPPGGAPPGMGPRPTEGFNPLSAPPCGPQGGPGGGPDKIFDDLRKKSDTR